MSDEKELKEELKEVTFDEIKVNKTSEPLVKVLPIGDGLGIKVEYNEISGAKIEQLQLTSMRECINLKTGEVDEIAKQEHLTVEIFDAVLVSVAGQKWSEPVRRQIKGPEYQALSKFVVSITQGNI